jgi:hypothetical protein
MTPGAQELLSLLAMLPDGMSDSDLVQSGIGIANILSCKATLIQTSLAYVDHCRVLRVLPPIREHIYRTYPARLELKSTLCQYFNAVIGLWERRRGSADSFAQIHRHLENFNSVFLDVLTTQSDDVQETIMSILLLNAFKRITNIGSVPLMAEVRSQINNWRNQPVYGFYLVEELQYWGPKPTDYEGLISIGNKYFDGADAAMQCKYKSYYQCPRDANIH